MEIKNMGIFVKDGNIRLGTTIGAIVVLVVLVVLLLASIAIVREEMLY